MSDPSAEVPQETATAASATTPGAQAAHRGTPSWMPGVLLAFGLASVVLLLLTDQFRQRHAVEDAFALRAYETIRVDIAISHLWLEEYVTGDAVDLDEIQRRLQQASERLDQLTGVTPLGSSDPNSTFATPPLHDAALRRRTGTLRPLLETFVTLSQERQQGYARNLPVGIGSPFDVEYDQVFDDLLRATDALQLDLELHVLEHQASTRRTFLGIVAFWSLLIAASALTLWTRDRRQKQAELALQASRAQLTHSQRMDAAGRLAGGLAHDLSNYLAAIRGHCELTQLKRPQGTQLADKMEMVIDTIDRASELVDRLLRFGRQRPKKASRVDANQVIEAVASLLEPSLGDRVTLHLNLAPGELPVHVDRAGLEHALANLLVNARDAMPEGGGLELSSHNLASDGKAAPQTRIQVRDEGIGIAAQDLPHIFEPFWSTKHSQGGSGLGLAVVEGFVQQAGGRLEVDSEVGVGTTFSLVFPPPPAIGTESATPGLDTAAPTRVSDEASWDDAGLGEVDIEGSETLLLVDDNEELLDATATVLEALGYRVLRAGDAAEARRLASQHTLDFAVVDWVLPDTDGGSLQEELQGIQQDKTKTPLPTLLISGHRLDERKGAPPVDFLSKRDFSALRLAMHIRQRLDGDAADAPNLN